MPVEIMAKAKRRAAFYTPVTVDQNSRDTSSGGTSRRFLGLGGFIALWTAAYVDAVHRTVPHA